jgi:hypothetical protein
VPVFDFPQDRFDIVDYRELTQSGIGNGNQCWRNLVGKVSPCSGRFGEVGIERDFVAAHFSLPKKDGGLIKLVPVVFAHSRADYEETSQAFAITISEPRIFRN